MRTASTDDTAQRWFRRYWTLGVGPGRTWHRSCPGQAVAYSRFAGPAREAPSRPLAIDSINGGGGVDKFRLKVWDIGTGSVVYDNQLGADDGAAPTTALGGGSIVIHSGK